MVRGVLILRIFAVKARSSLHYLSGKNFKMAYQFTNNWFEAGAKAVWDVLIPQVFPTRILEIGSYEGASTCYVIEKLGVSKAIELHCVDTWEGGIEHQDAGIQMQSVEQRFHHNTQLAVARIQHPVELVTHKGYSDRVLAKLIAEGKQGYFDFIYIDGSHQAPDVLCDAVLSFKLLKTHGVMAFDDYLWQESLPNGADPIRCPKVAIDAFTNIYCRKLRILRAPLYQLYVEKISD